MGNCTVSKPVNVDKEERLDKLVEFSRGAFNSGSKIDALKFILSVQTGRDAFINFLRTEYAEEQMCFFKVINETLLSLYYNII